MPTTQFNDNELGIALDYPEGWGQTLITVEADSRLLTKKITFTNQPNLFFEISSTALRSDDQNLQKTSATDDDLSKYCKENIRNDRSEPLSDWYDMYRLNGTDMFGICPEDRGNVKAIVYQTDKSGSPGNEIFSKKDLDQVTGSAILKFSKRYYLKIQNPLYGPLVVHQNGIPDVQSQNYCYSKWNIPNDPTAYLKTYKCISYNDKPLIENAFSEFDKSEFNEQVKLVLNSIKINQVKNSSQYFTDHFSDLKKYEDDEYTYFYPQILISDRWNKDNNLNVVKEISKESIVQADEAFEVCDGPCMPSILTALGWDNEKRLLDNNPPDGETRCVEGINGSSLCEIKTFGKNKFLIRYTGRFGGDSVIWKSYIIYNNGMRYEINSPELGSQGADPALFKSIENHLIQKVYEDIAESFMFKNKK